MRIDFNLDDPERDVFSSYGRLHGRSESRHWAKILRQLREESPWKGCGHSIEDEKFHTWLKDTWQIKVITSGGFMPGYISAIDVNDSAYTMLLLRFPK